MNLTNSQYTLINPQLEGYYHSLHSEYINSLNIEFKNYILEESDIGSIILCRIDGMPLLEEVFEDEFEYDFENNFENDFENDFENEIENELPLQD